MVVSLGLAWSARLAAPFPRSAVRCRAPLQRLMAHLGFPAGERVLIVGDGDFSYSAGLVASRPDLDVVASTLIGAEEDLEARYPGSSANIRAISALGGHVRFGVDATDLSETAALVQPSCIRFNFPHIDGKSNTKHNRALLSKFLASAAEALRGSRGRVEVSLVEGQGGSGAHGERGLGDAEAHSDRHWRLSWMASVAGADAGLLMTSVEPFTDQDAPGLEGYVPQGARGRGRRFDTRDVPLLHEFRLPGHGTSAVFAHCFHTELHLQIPVDWDNTADDKGLVGCIRTQLQQRGLHGMEDVSMEYLEDFIYPEGDRRCRAWSCLFRSTHRPLPRARAQTLWNAVRDSAESYTPVHQPEGSESARGSVQVRTKSTTTVSRPLPSWFAPSRN